MEDGEVCVLMVLFCAVFGVKGAKCKQGEREEQEE
jgi:hypothetical protein